MNNWKNLRDVTVVIPGHFVGIRNVKWVPQSRHVFETAEKAIDRFGAASFWNKGWRTKSNVLLTIEGVPVPRWRIEEIARNRKVESDGSYSDRYLEYLGDRANKGMNEPKKARGHYDHTSRYYRRVKTHPIRREADFHDRFDEDCMEHNVKVRAKRNAANIYTSWDDLKNFSGYDRNWKKTRKTQYRHKP